MLIKEPQKSSKPEQKLIWARGQLLQAGFLLLQPWSQELGPQQVTAQPAPIASKDIQCWGKQHCLRSTDLHFHSGPMHDVTPFLMLPLSSIVKQMPESFADIKKQTAEELGCKWQKLSSPQQTSTPRASGRKTTQFSPGTAAFQWKRQTHRKATQTSSLPQTHSRIQQFHQFQDEWWIPYRHHFLNLTLLCRTALGSETAG